MDRTKMANMFRFKSNACRNYNYCFSLGKHNNKNHDSPQLVYFLRHRIYLCLINIRFSDIPLFSLQIVFIKRTYSKGIFILHSFCTATGRASVVISLQSLFNCLMKSRILLFLSFLLTLLLQGCVCVGGGGSS